MLVELSVFVATLTVPAAIGFGLGTMRPGNKRVTNGLIAAAPVAVAFFAFAGWIALTQDMSCEVEPCQNMAPLWAIVMFVLGVVTFITGLGVGMIADAFARNRAEKIAE
ncbi:hypothetical protein [Aurantiacibacter flavus]|uniref:Uncharacterized protein n=1 Tax=Aurantiacibacter flavus TaxID=3145232 RepID=A0ABV0CT66_9SPHN